MISSNRKSRQSNGGKFPLRIREFSLLIIILKVGELFFLELKGSDESDKIVKTSKNSELKWKMSK